MNIKQIISYLNFVRFLPHVILFIINRNKVKSDMKRCTEHHLHTCKGIGGLLYLLTFDKAFRALFYYRIGNFSYFVRFLAPTFDTLMVNLKIKIGQNLLFWKLSNS